MAAFSYDKNHTLHGVGWMLATGLCFVGVTGIVRYLGTDIPAAQAAFVRFAFGVLFLVPSLMVLRRDGLPAGSWPLFVGRGILHTAAVICWFYAMARLPVAEATAIGYLNPVLVSLGGALIFSEVMARRRVVTVLVALLGAVVVLRPGLREVTDGHLAQLAAACFFAGSYLIAKRLSQMAPAGAVVGLLAVLVTAALAPFALALWVPITVAQCGWLALVAAFATWGHYCMMRAFAAAPLAVTQPVTFLQLVWAMLLGVLGFDESVDLYVMLGGAIIIGAICWLTWREARGEAIPPVA